MVGLIYFEESFECTFIDMVAFVRPVGMGGGDGGLALSFYSYVSQRYPMRCPQDTITLSTSPTQWKAPLWSFVLPKRRFELVDELYIIIININQFIYSGTCALFPPVRASSLSSSLRCRTSFIR